MIKKGTDGTDGLELVNAGDREKARNSLMNVFKDMVVDALTRDIGGKIWVMGRAYLENCDCDKSRRSS